MLQGRLRLPRVEFTLSNQDRVSFPDSNRSREGETLSDLYNLHSPAFYYLYTYIQLLPAHPASPIEPDSRCRLDLSIAL
jgi:hypothetical protein